MARGAAAEDHSLPAVHAPRELEMFVVLLHLGLLVEPSPTRFFPGLADRVYAPRLPDVGRSQQTSVVRFPNFFSSEEIDELHAAAAAVRQTAGERVRANGLEEGSWRTVFLNHRMRELLPHLYAKLLAAARQADEQPGWGVLDGERNLVYCTPTSGTPR